MDARATIGLPRMDMDKLARQRSRLVLLVNNAHTPPILGTLEKIEGKEVTLVNPLLLSTLQNIDQLPNVVRLKSGWRLGEHYTQVYAGSEIPKALYELNEQNTAAHWEIYAHRLKRGERPLDWLNPVRPENALAA
jgi:hypothetical protein